MNRSITQEEDMKPQVVIYTFLFITSYYFICNLSAVFQVHKYIIQALVLRDSWPLTRECWDFVLAQRNAEKPDPPDCKYIK